MDFGRDVPMLREVRWYFNGKAARPFPGPCFGSTNWEKVKRSNAGLGEQWDSPFTYDKGIPPPGLLYDGRFCGELWQFSEGVDPGTPPLRISSGGLPTCCGAGDGVLLGGKSGPYVHSSSLTGTLLGAALRSVAFRSSLIGLKAGDAEPSSIYLRSSAGGSKLGTVNTNRFVYRGFLGIKGAPAGVPKQPVAGLVGIKGAPSSVRSMLAPKYLGAVGIKGAPAGEIPVTNITYAGSIGIKGAPAMLPLKTGIKTTCCPGALIPQSLGGHDGGGVLVTLTYSQASGGWLYYDSVNAINVILSCPAGSWVLAPASTPKCTQHITISSMTCDPFSIHITNSITGSLCLVAGTYTLTV